MGSDLTPLEREAMATLVRHDHPVMAALREQLAACRVEGRDASTAGFYTRLVIPTGVARAAVDRLRLGDLHAEIPGLRHGVGFILWVEGGVLTQLEGFTFDEPWPARVDAFSLVPIHPQGNTPTDLEQVEAELALGEEATMDHDDAVRMLEAIAKAFDEHDLDGIMAHFADDAVFEGPRGVDPWGTRFEGREAVRDGFAARFAGIPDVRYREDEHFVDGDRGASAWTLSGTATAGERIEVHGCDLWTFRDGLVVKKDSFWKIRTPG